jgi:hypothetical protein
VLGREVYRLHLNVIYEREQQTYHYKRILLAVVAGRLEDEILVDCRMLIRNKRWQ